MDEACDNLRRFHLNISIYFLYYNFSFQLQPNSAAGSGALEHDPCCLFRQVTAVRTFLNRDLIVAQYYYKT